MMIVFRFTILPLEARCLKPLPARNIISSSVISQASNQTEQSFNIDYRCDVGTNESANKGKMVVYPNPSSGKFVIRWEGQKLNKQILLNLLLT
ncbi:MAG: hypothetical protein U0V54_05875 [Saprospiraceae bacterium]